MINLDIKNKEGKDKKRYLWKHICCLWRSIINSKFFEKWNISNKTNKCKGLLTITPKQVPLYKKLNFTLRVSPVNVTKATVSCGFGHIYWGNP